MSLNIYLFLTNYRFKRTRCFFKSHTSISQKPRARFTKATRPFFKICTRAFSKVAHPPHVTQTCINKKNPRSLSEENATRKHPSGR